MIYSNAALGAGVSPTREDVAQRRNHPVIVTRPDTPPKNGDGVAQASLGGDISGRFSVHASRPSLTPPKIGVLSAERQQSELHAFHTLLETFSDDARKYGMRSANILAEQSRTLNKNALLRSEEKGKVAEERQQRADKMSSIFSWIAKIVAVVVTVISVVAAIFTGGTSLVLAGAAIAYLVVDKGVEMATGKSITGRAMAALSGPLGKLQKKLIEAMKGVLGEETAAIMAGVIIATVVAIIAIAAVLIARTAATSLIKALPTSKILTALTQKMTTFVGKSAVNSISRADQLAQVGTAGFGSIHSGGKVVIADHERTVAESEADMQLLQTTTRLSSETERQLWSATQALEETLRDLAESISKSIGLHVDSARAIAFAGRRAA